MKDRHPGWAGNGKGWRIEKPQMKSNVIEKTSRVVIDSKLLMALRDDNLVAILACEKDLDLFIKALLLSKDPKAWQMGEDFLKLKQAAFGTKRVRRKLDIS